MGKVFFGLLLVGVVVLLIAVGVLFQMLFSSAEPARVPDGRMSKGQDLPSVGTTRVSGDKVRPEEPAVEPVTATAAVPVDESDVGGKTDEAQGTMPERGVPGSVVRLPAGVPGQQAEPVVEPAGDHVGVLTFLKGGASAVDGKGKRRPLALESRIFANDRIETGEGSKAAVKFTDDTVVWFGEQTSIVIDEYVFNAEKKSECGCVLRFIKGVFRTATGAITSLNPERFKVKLRLATIGIRGCEFAIQGDNASHVVYVLGLGAAESVVVLTTVNGAAVTDEETGQSMAVADDTSKVILVDHTPVGVTIVGGRGCEVEDLQADQVRTITEITSSLPPARLEVMPKADGASFMLHPSGTAAPNPTTGKR